MLTVGAAGARLTGTLVAGMVRAGGPGFNLAAGLAAGVVVGAAVAVAGAFRRPAADPEVGTPGDGAGTIPAPGATVRVHTHFGPRGGYVRHEGLLVWAVPGADGRRAGFTPGVRCRVAGREGAVLTVVAA